MYTRDTYGKRVQFKRSAGERVVRQKDYKTFKQRKKGGINKLEVAEIENETHFPTFEYVKGSKLMHLKPFKRANKMLLFPFERNLFHEMSFKVHLNIVVDYSEIARGKFRGERHVNMDRVAMYSSQKVLRP